MKNLSDPDPRGESIRAEMRQLVHRLELLSLSLQRAAGDPYGRPVRARLRLVNPEPEGVPHGQ